MSCATSKLKSPDIYNKNKQEMWDYVMAEPTPIYGKKPFANKTTEKLYQKYLKARKKAL